MAMLQQVWLTNIYPSTRTTDRSLINGIVSSGFLFANISQVIALAIIDMPFVPFDSFN